MYVALMDLYDSSMLRAQVHLCSTYQEGIPGTLLLRVRSYIVRVSGHGNNVNSVRIHDHDFSSRSSIGSTETFSHKSCIMLSLKNYRLLWLSVVMYFNSLSEGRCLWFSVKGLSSLGERRCR